MSIYTLLESIKDLEHRVPLEGFTFEYFVHNGESRLRRYQSNDDLRLLWLVVFGEAWALEFVLFERFKVQGSNVIEDKIKSLFEFLSSCVNRRSFYGFLVAQ